MIPWKQLETAEVPGGGGELRLLQRGAEFSIRLGHNELMNSRIHGSEEALAEIACSRIGRRVKPRVLIGGLGMGFTLRAALDELGTDAHVVVAELVPAVIAWNRTMLAPSRATPSTMPASPSVPAMSGTRSARSALPTTPSCWTSTTARKV